jgi:hypothetical protein
VYGGAPNEDQRSALETASAQKAAMGGGENTCFYWLAGDPAKISAPATS